MEIIHNPYEAQNILSNLLKSANKEILITLPTKADYGLTRDYVGITRASIAIIKKCN